MKYNKKGERVKGSLLLIRHTDAGNYRIKSNALFGLALGEGADGTGPFGWATFSGKGTYIEPRWTDAQGNYTFRAYVEDRNESGTGVDQFWIQVDDKNGTSVGDLSLPSPAAANTVDLGGGNIVAPH